VEEEPNLLSLKIYIRLDRLLITLLLNI